MKGVILKQRGGTMQASSAALEFAAQISDADTLQGAERLLADYVAKFGFIFSAMGRAASKERRAVGGEVWARSAHRWPEHWSKQRYAKVDPAVWYWRTCPNNAIVTWSELKRRRCGPRPDLMDEARDFGLRDG